MKFFAMHQRQKELIAWIVIVLMAAIAVLLVLTPC